MDQKPVNPWLVAIAVMFATFMEVLDTTVVNVSLPHIASSMTATTEDREGLRLRWWVAGDTNAFFGLGFNTLVNVLVPEERRATLMAQPDIQNPGWWNFTIRLCGEGETVFFDV